jgi:predicted P-loop ATPase/GTPase
MSDIIKVDVEGTKFKVLKDTLMNIPYFRNMFDYDIIQHIYIDRSAKGFSHILRLARCNNNSKYKFPIKYIDEIDFFLIKYDEKDLYDPNNNLKTNIASIINQTTEIKQELSDIRDDLSEIRDDLSEIRDDRGLMRRQKW